jgi:nucleotide-binding universal stress UspA family protein
VLRPGTGEEQISRSGKYVAHMTDAPALIAFDGSEPAAEAIGALAALLPGATVVIALVRGPALNLEHAAVTRAALPVEVVAAAVRAHESAAAAAAQRIAERGVAIARKAGLDATAAVVESGTAWRGLCAVADAQGAGVIVCGSRGQGGISRAMLGSTSSSLLYHAQRPVLVVPPGGAGHAGRVVIGYDGSDGAREAIALTARLVPGRPAIVAHAWSSPIRRSFTGKSLMGAPLDEIQEVASSLDELFAGEAEEVAAEGAALADEHGLDARALAVESSAAWRGVIEVAEAEGAALIVAGSRGRGALASTVLGSISSGLVHNADVPVLVARRVHEAAG